MKTKLLFTIFTIFTLTVGLYGGYRFGKSNLKQGSEQVSQENFPFLAKRIFVESPNDIIINFISLRDELRFYVVGRNEKIGIYFEYLPNGTSIGINEKEDFFRASLIKVPVVMRAYKLIEEGKLRKDDVLVIERKHIDPTYGELWKAGEGSRLTVLEAVRLIITKSDNTAYEALNDKIGNSILQEELGQERSVTNVYDFLDIPRKELGVNQYITPKNFSSILKSLYFSAYLSYEYSNEILDFMTTSEYTQSLVEPLPKEIRVAHKFGVYSLDKEGFNVHSDCGIIYFPQRPYILCVMVNTPDSDIAEGLIREISEKVYKFVQRANKGG